MSNLDVLLVEDPKKLERCGDLVFKSSHLFQLILNAPQLQCLIPQFGYDAVLSGLASADFAFKYFSIMKTTEFASVQAAFEVSSVL